MTKFSSLARARVIGPEGGAWSGGASGGAREGAAGVDVLVVSSSPKHEFRVQWGGSGAFVVKNYNATSWHKLLH